MKRKKQSWIDKIPEDWKVVKLGEICKIESGNTAPQKYVYFENGKFPFIRMQHLNELEEDKYVKNYDLINEKAIEEKRMKIFKKGSILLAKSGESIRTEKKAILKQDSYVVNHLAVLEILENSKVYNEYLFYFFKKFKLSSLLAQTTTPSINLNILQKLKIPLPPLPEQKAIAQILSIVDEAIQKVDEIIAKTERLKKGLMQKLLTKGIGHKEFKDTEIGRIPKEWEVVKLSEVAIVRRGASPRPKGDPRYFGGSIPWIKISDLTKYKKTIYLQATDDTITEEGKKRSLYLPDGSLIISNSGTIGEPAIIATGRGGCIHDGFIYIAPLIHRVDKFFLYYFFEFKKTKLQARAQKGTQENLNTSIWKSIRLPCPHLPEQQKIAEILSTVDEKLELERKRKEKLERIKKGLMNDLLTGKKRVKLK